MGKAAGGRWKIALTVLVTLVVTVIALNFRSPEKRVTESVEHRFALADPQFEREMGNLMGPAILPGNRVTALANGDEIFPAMLGAIAAARRSICFETYIYWSGHVGRAFADALSERARAGVKVHVMLDWVGSGRIESSTLDEMKDAGVQVERYHPLRWYTLARMNNRTHRKLLVVDGAIGFTGGVGIADEWSGHAQDPEHWRDEHFKLEGPAVAEMQAAFLDNWTKTTGAVLNGPDYFPPLAPTGDQRAHLFVSSPAGGSASMRLMYLLAIAAAERSIDIEASYFVPDDLMRDALVAARERGVRIRVLVPDQHMDSEVVRVASKRAWGPLLEHGIEVSIYEPTMLHVKMLVFDGRMVSVGSTNFDMRSFELNDEASLNVYDQAFARDMTALFERDLRQSKPYTADDWRKRPWRERFFELVVQPLNTQL